MKMNNNKIKSVYVHIPFCDNICSYCDFCKFIKNDYCIDKYLLELNNEIIKIYKNDIIDTLYIGGGTPSCLNINQLEKLFNILKKFRLSKNIEFTFECNVESITKEKLELLYKNGVNRLSIGVQSFNSKILKYLGRNYNKEEIINKVKLAQKIGFNNINIDLIYATKYHTNKILLNDIYNIVKLDIQHISTYSLIIEPNTMLYIDSENNIDEEKDLKMYNLICEELDKNNFMHYEISNFSKEDYESKHNLTYWNNNNYYGFGLGASSYIGNIRSENTRSLNKYLSGLYIKESNNLDLNTIIENEFILGLRKIMGINKKYFYNKYKINVCDIEVVNKLVKEEKLIDNGLNIYINKNYLYISNEILLNFLDIDYIKIINKK